jgi:hypothetical protein
MSRPFSVVVKIVVVVESSSRNLAVLLTLLLNCVVDAFADESRQNDDEKGEKEESEDEDEDDMADEEEKKEEDEEEDMEEEDDEDMRKDSFAHTDSVDAALLEAMIENKLLKARLDAESKESDPEEDEEEMDEEEEDEEEYEMKKRKDAADILNTWISVADELTPALVRGDAVVEGIEIEDGKLRFDSVDATDLKEAYIKLHGLDELLESANRYDSVAIDTAFQITKKSQSLLDTGKKNRNREALDSALKGSKRNDSSDIRFASIQSDIEAGRKRLGR